MCGTWPAVTDRSETESVATISPKAVIEVLHLVALVRHLLLEAAGQGGFGFMLASVSDVGRLAAEHQRPSIPYRLHTS